MLGHTVRDPTGDESSNTDEELERSQHSSSSGRLSNLRVVCGSQGGLPISSDLDVEWSFTDQTTDTEARKESTDQHHLLVHGGGLEDTPNEEDERTTGD